MKPAALVCLPLVSGLVSIVRRCLHLFDPHHGAIAATPGYLGHLM
jgi:hypothetical protein